MFRLDDARSGPVRIQDLLREHYPAAWTAREIALQSGLPIPRVETILTGLERIGLVKSRFDRGSAPRHLIYAPTSRMEGGPT